MRSALILLAALLVALFVYASLPACVPSIYYCPSLIVELA